MTGKWTVHGQWLHLKNDPEFVNTGDHTVVDTLASGQTLVISKGFYPDLGLVDWRLRRNALKQITTLDLGCFTEKARYRRISSQK
jgi:hypothetical protein